MSLIATAFPSHPPTTAPDTEMPTLLQPCYNLSSSKSASASYSHCNSKSLHSISYTGSPFF